MNTFKRCKEIIATITNYSRRYVVLTILIRFLALCNTYLLLYINKHIIDELSMSVVGGEIYITSIIFVLSIYVAVELVSTLIYNIMQYHLGKINLEYNDHICTVIINSISKLDMTYYDDPASYNQTKQVSRFVTSILNNYNSILEFVFSIISLGISLFISVKISVYISLLSIMSSVPGLIIRRKLKQERHELEKTILNKQRFIDYLSGIYSNKYVEMEMQLYGFSSYILDRIHQNQKDLRTLKTNFGLHNAKREMIIAIINKSIFLLQQICLISVIISKSMTIGDYSYYTGIIGNFSGSIENIVGLVNDIIINDTKYQEYLKIINRKPHIKTDGMQKLSKNDNFDIVFENVSFIYPNSNTYVLKDISFSIKSGQKVALIGLNGTGKSTLIKLLLRFYDPICGRILLNGIDIREYDLTSYRKAFSVMFQELIMYLLPIRDNIIISDIGRLNTSDEEKTIYAILGDLGISKADLDIHKYYGKEFCEDGLVLSKGQQQRIHAARTLFYSGRIYILDEPAASLDSISEERFLDTLEKYSCDKTVIYITHRYNNLSKMDNIILINNGYVQESGSHTELLNKNGLYKKLFSMQNIREKKTKS